MPKNGWFVLSDLQTVLGLHQVNVACRKCERRGRVSVARLIRDYGPDTQLPHFAVTLATGCPRQKAHSIYDQCGAWFPGIGEALNAATHR
jgi:hypothetical protein